MTKNCLQEQKQSLGRFACLPTLINAICQPIMHHTSTNTIYHHRRGRHHHHSLARSPQEKATRRGPNHLCRPPVTPQPTVHPHRPTTCQAADLPPQAAAAAAAAPAPAAAPAAAPGPLACLATGGPGAAAAAAARGARYTGGGGACPRRSRPTHLLTPAPTSMG